MAQSQPPSRPNLDRLFFVRFGFVVLGLHMVAGVFWLIAYGVGDYERDPRVERNQIAERIEPLASVVTSSAELTKLAAGSGAPLGTAGATDAGGAGAGTAAASGERVMQQVCTACHGTGVLGAPKSGDKAAWQARLEQAGGVDGLVASAIKGKNQMPPRGGAPQLTDAQIRAAIEVMLK